MTQFYLDKASGTFADALLAIGFASLIGELSLAQYGTQKGIVLQDNGSSYLLSVPKPIDPAALSDEDLAAFQIVLPLDSNRQREKQAKKGSTHKLDGFLYDEEVEKDRIYREAKKRKDPDLPPEPDERLGHYRAISAMNIVGSFNELALRWDQLTIEQKRFHLAILLKFFATPVNDVAMAINEWKEFAKKEDLKGSVQASALQIVNPTTGKGANRPKANGLTFGNQDSFWLLELLKFRGFLDGAAPLGVQNSDDRKTYVIQPRRIELTDLQSMMRRFRATFWSTTAIKLDILASLRFALVFVEHYEHLRAEDPLRLSWMPAKLTSLAQGFAVGFYKYLGSAHATMNIATIGLPSWLPPLETSEQVEQAKRVLEEHIRLIRNLQTIRNGKLEEGAEEYELLRLYRDFLSGNHASPLWEFAAHYGFYLLQQRYREKNIQRHIQQLQYQGLETIVMAIQPELTDITGNSSFRKIAAAIRLSTVYPQYLKARGKDPVYEIRYGLGQELLRKVRHRNEFMIALGEFLQSYAAENGRVAERAGREGGRPAYSRTVVTYDDVHALSALIEQFKSSELIGTMLVGCGYLSDFKNRENAAVPETVALIADELSIDEVNA